MSIIKMVRRIPMAILIFFGTIIIAFIAAAEYVAHGNIDSVFPDRDFKRLT